MSKLSRKTYVTQVPRTIYYRYSENAYTTTCPPNDEYYDVFEIELTPRQEAYDKEFWLKKFNNAMPINHSLYKNIEDENDVIFLDWGDWMSDLFMQYNHAKTANKTYAPDIDLALNRIL